MTPRVVVGVDGSSTAESALAWALEVAACHRADVDALHAWRWQLPGPLPVVPDLPAQLAVAARRTVECSLDRALAARPAKAPPVQARARTAEGDPGAALVAAATDAELLVVGRHGQSDLSRHLVGPMLGSVASHCLSRSTAPVVVVPTAHGPADRTGSSSGSTAPTPAPGRCAGPTGMHGPSAAGSSPC